MDKNTMITRDVYTIAKRLLSPINVVKSIYFKVNSNYTTNEIYNLIEVLRKDTTIILTIFNQKKKECILLFISNKDDSLLKRHIKTFLEMEAV